MLQSLEWHLQEVSRCLEEKPEDLFGHGETGRILGPSPDGYPYQLIPAIRLQGMVPMFQRLGLS